MVDQFDMEGVSSHMPSLVDFFQALVRDGNAKIFNQERDQNKSEKRRGVIHGICDLVSYYYNLEIHKNDSDLMCIDRLIANPVLVTKENYIQVYEALSVLLDKVLFDQNDVSKEHNRRSVFLNALSRHEWFTDAERCALKNSKVFLLTTEKTLQFSSEQHTKKVANMENVIEIVDFSVHEAVFKLIKIVEGPKSMDWLHAAIQLVQVTTGARWIESVIVSSFELSELPAYDTTNYIIIKGVAKDEYRANKKVCELLNAAKEISDHDEYARLSMLSQEEKSNLVTEKIIAKPLLGLHGTTPLYIVGLVKDFRTYINETFGRQFQNTLADREFLDSKLKQNSIKMTESVWSSNDIARFGRMKTHIWRKIYASYTHRLFQPNGNINIWTMKVLGHVSPITSFNYVNVVVTKQPQLEALGIQEKIDMLIKEHTLRTEEHKRMHIEHNTLKEKVNSLGEVVTKLKAQMDNIQSVSNLDYVELVTNSGGIVQFQKYGKRSFTKRSRDAMLKKSIMESRVANIIDDLEKHNVHTPSLNESILYSLRIPRSLQRQIRKVLALNTKAMGQGEVAINEK